MKPTTSSSEIDDIFSRKAATSQHSSSNHKQKKRKNKRSQTQLAKSKRPPPEIVLDPSIQLSHVSTSNTISLDRSVRPVSPSKKRKLVETRQDQDKFRDSRGTVPRRKTDEGFAIYKEDELGINAEAGGTPLCPFDCNCCF